MCYDFLPNKEIDVFKKLLEILWSYKMVYEFYQVSFHLESTQIKNGVSIKQKRSPKDSRKRMSQFGIPELENEHKV